jgi:hypothetical protein
MYSYVPDYRGFGQLLNRRIEYPAIFRDGFKENDLSLIEGIIVAGYPIEDKAFYVTHIANALVYTSFSALWLGVTTGKGTIVVLGNAVLRIPTYLNLSTPGSEYGIYKNTYYDSRCILCSALLSRIRVVKFLTDTADSQGYYKVLVDVNGLPLFEYDRLYRLICYQNTYRLAYSQETIVYPNIYPGCGVYGNIRQNVGHIAFGILDIYGSGRVENTWIHNREIPWFHPFGEILLFPCTNDPCTGSNEIPPDPDPQCNSVTPQHCLGPCNIPHFCEFLYTTTGWSLVNDLCIYSGTGCNCNYSEDELNWQICYTRGRMPQTGDYLRLPCCAAF